MKKLLIMPLMALLLAGCFTAQEVHQVVNDVRAVTGAQRTTWSYNLAGYAQQQADRIAANNSPNTMRQQHSNVEVLLQIYPGYFSRCAENLTSAPDHWTAAQLVQNWLVSVDHSSSLLDLSYQEAGTGVTYAHGRVWAALILCRRA